MDPLARSLAALDQALDAPRRAGIPLGNWRWVVRQRVAAVREALTGGSGEVGSGAGTTDQGWLAARGGAAFGVRTDLLGRLGALGDEVLASADVEVTRDELKRLVADIAAHLAAGSTTGGSTGGAG